MAHRVLPTVCPPDHHCVTPCDLIKAGRPTEPRGPTTGPKKTPHPLGCQEHCKCGVSAPAIFTVMPNSATPHLPDNGVAEPPTLAATMSAHVGWQHVTEGGTGRGGLLQDGTLIERLSDEPGHHIYPPHPSCPTNGHK
ncbi:unnamed protein product [Pleuronectes platessa]|uniref:Uncharacterized protein n=1 Tax=Pleuronectes platessa TaxID=8262 RepID=A0A9N7ZBL7_PLEPL|nr:unnamed protein product [Pleuronectes platessa]